MANEKLNIFLSASIPLENRDKKYFETADIIAIRDSVLALTSIALPHFKLIWGGHPSITPLIAQVLQHFSLDVQENVTLYQSAYFEKYFPLANESVAHIIKTEDLNNRDDSLNEMRNQMIAGNDFYAGFFIGGMDGVKDEYEMFIEKHPEAKAFPIASTGGAALEMYKKYCNGMPELETEFAYSSLFRKLLEL